MHILPALLKPDCKIQVIPFMISFADFVIFVNGVSVIVDIIVFSRK